jgi:hypothetical protein
MKEKNKTMKSLKKEEMICIKGGSIKRPKSPDGTIILV